MLVPVFTSDYVLMNDGGHFFIARDEEMVQRYLVFAAFFPQDTESVQIGTLPVFGNHAGVAYARAKRWYQFTHFFQGTFDKTIPDFIRHQDLRWQLENGLKKPDFDLVKKYLSQFSLDYVVTTEDIPPALRDAFEKIAQVDKFSVYRKKKA